MLRYHKVKARRRRAQAGGPSVARLSVHLQLFLSVRVFVRPSGAAGLAGGERSGGGGREGGAKQREAYADGGRDGGREGHIFGANGSFVRLGFSSHQNERRLRLNLGEATF